MSETERSTAEKAKTALLWIVTVIGALGIAAAGVTKFASAEMWNELFTEWGYSIGFKSLIGVLEVSAAALVLVPRFATYAAALVCAIMLGAVYTVIVNQSDLGIVAPMGNLILFSVIAFARRNDRWTPGK